MSDLIMRAVWGDLDLTEYPFGFEFGSDFGAPEKVSESLPQLLLDGEIEIAQRQSNRTISFSVLVESSDLLALAEAEQLLALEAARPQNELMIDPGDGWAPGLVYNTFPAQVRWIRDDELEQQNFRRYTVEMQAAPFARSVNETVVEAMSDGGVDPTPVPVTVVVDNCTSATGWDLRFSQTGWTKTPVTVVNSGVEAQVTSPTVLNSTSDFSVGMARTFSSPVDLSTTDLLQIDMDVAYTRFAFRGYSFLIDGQPAPLAARNGTRVWVDVSAFSSVTILHVYTTHRLRPQNSSTPPGYVRLRVEEITRGDVAPIVGTGRQQFRSLSVDGSARTQGSLQIAHETDALGEVLVYTNKDDGSGYQPSCRQYRVSGGQEPTPDTSTTSGAYEPLDGAAAVTFDIPARTLPEGSYGVLARIRADSTLTALVNVTARTRAGSTDSSSVSTGEFATLPAGQWEIAELGRLALPPTAVPAGSQAMVRISVSSASRVDIDDLWLFHTTLGSYSLVKCGTGTPAEGGPFSRVWLDTASLSRPRPAIWLGTQADRSDARHADGAEVRAQGTHVFTPGDVNLFTVTSGALNAAASLRFYPRWHSNAAK